MKPSKNAIQIRKVETVFDDVERMRSEIAQRAYEIFLERGGHSGWDIDDWLAAEGELAWKPPVELYQQANEFVIICPMSGVDIRDLDVQVTAEDLLIESKAAGHTHIEDGRTVHLCEFSRGRLFRFIRFPQPVDLGRVKAEYHDGIFQITAAIAQPEKAKNAPSAAA